LLEALYEQTFPIDNMEVVVADGFSTDNTRDEIAAFQKGHPDMDVHIVDNTLRSIPSALNSAIKASRGGIIVRLDAHSKPYPDYVERCVAALEENRGENVGGVWEIHPGADTWIARSISVAAAHPLGVGDALYRHAKHAVEVDTVPFGSFKRELVDLIGYFDETLLTNEDYEFNTRVRKAGGRIWLDPSIRSIYFSRSTILELGRQYWRYGYWKRRMLSRYANTVRWRQALPPLFVLSLIVFALASLFIRFPALILAAELVFYIFILFLAGIQTSSHEKKPYLVIGLPLAISVMHISWGSGFLWSILPSRNNKHG
jgi:glycosyltransferase involved in cell wall biosynthesis